MTHGLTRAQLGTLTDDLDANRIELEDAQYDLEIAQAKVVGARARYEAAKDRLDDYLHGDLIIRILNGEDLK